jgi:hypothetical protein
MKDRCFPSSAWETRHKKLCFPIGSVRSRPRRTPSGSRSFQLENSQAELGNQRISEIAELDPEHYRCFPSSAWETRHKKLCFPTGSVRSRPRHTPSGSRSFRLRIPKRSLGTSVSISEIAELDPTR